MNKCPVIIVGGGGHAKVLINTLLLCKVPIIGIVDNAREKFGTTIMGIKILGDDTCLSDYAPAEICLVNGIGSVETMNFHTVIYQKLNKKYRFYSVIHPSAVIGAEVIIGEGVQIMAGAVIQPGSRIGNNTIINTRVAVDHDCQIGAHVHIAPGCVLSGGVTIGNATHIGTGSVIIQGKTIGSNVLAGAGSVIINDIPDQVQVYGVPAKLVKR